MQLARVMALFNPGANFGGVGQGTNKAERLEWQDICGACANMKTLTPWKLALMKYQGDWSVSKDVYADLLAWCKEVRWDHYAPHGKRFNIGDDRLNQLIRAAVWEYVQAGPCKTCNGTKHNLTTLKPCSECNGVGVSRISTAKLSRRAEMPRTTFIEWDWCYKEILQHIFILETIITARINRKLQ